ncbi:protein of unknown function [uncultured Woeseiaceae bacterium]|uniref:Uncharacterized protein n=1 Tax=uncultured Woeseiaceae bacterium TaxID=1983305 RepID=A0A7D9H4L1_9GAMM|nr:protein of unknown function [uncultured Woeseiaceae bacterium]
MRHLPDRIGCMSCALRISRQPQPATFGVLSATFPDLAQLEVQPFTSKPYGYAIQYATAIATTAQPGAQLLPLNTVFRSCGST